ISGHCDERGSDEYNLALGNRRATAAKQYLVSHGIDGGRIETSSYGEERPLAQGHDEGAWAQNRRDEFEIIGGGDVRRVELQVTALRADLTRSDSVRRAERDSTLAVIAAVQAALAAQQSFLV